MDTNIMIQDNTQNNIQGYGSMSYSNNHQPIKKPLLKKNDFKKDLEQNSPPTQNHYLGFFARFTFEYYYPFFDLSNSEILQRISLALKPFSKDFLSLISSKPDLYGPFWIYTTLIFMIAAAGNFSRYIAGYQTYDIGFVPTAAILVYGIGYLAPIGMTFLMKIFGNEVGYFSMICLYGYSMVCFIPISLLCTIPQGTLQWAFLIYGLVNSILFLTNNLWEELGKLVEKKKYTIFGIIVCCQIVVVMMQKYYFFGQIYQPQA